MKRLAVLAVAVSMLTGCATLERLEKEFSSAEMSTPVYSQADTNRNLRVAPGVGIAYVRENKQVNSGRYAEAEKYAQEQRRQWDEAMAADKARHENREVKSTPEEACVAAAEIGEMQVISRAMNTGDFSLARKYNKENVYNNCMEKLKK
ncbi:hypothetical protein CPT_Muldoon_044 [Serratia phage Muldoon]|uniref:Lipoprotein n=1 Tax=Serratia phage Muldoon TaxID=2601678 RepID=A0A5P8PIX9_9CAUD|nr:hypothetical protein HYP94_gp043 [Serratia phage Muldoon]QFR56000.1 hypothetical protein CPT_Muldoon_044 [Serratia phage Muldoon]